MSLGAVPGGCDAGGVSAYLLRARGEAWAAAAVLWVVLAVAGLLGLPAPAGAGEAQPLAEDPVLEERLVRLAAELRCLVCQNESLAGSRADLAEDLRDEIRGLMRAGKSDQEVVAFLTERYGDFILYRPPFRPQTWLLWLGPVLIVLAGASGVFFFLRRRGRSAVASGAPRASLSTPDVPFDEEATRP